jgi:hypothetical protein
MNCDECKEHLGVYLENDLGEEQASAVRMHLALCTQCAVVCEDLSALIDVCAESADLVPNSQAIWCRINNIIESEIKPPAAALAETPRKRFWQFTFAQLVTALGCIAVVSSVATFVVVRNYTQPADGEFAGRSASTQTTFEKLLSKVGLAETPQQARERRMRERHAAIDYWNARVQARRQQWDPPTRDAFDRTLGVIDQSVNEYTTILERDPYDDLSDEMLDSVLNEKMNLLRDFADL